MTDQGFSVGKVPTFVEFTFLVNVQVKDSSPVWGREGGCTPVDVPLTIPIIILNLFSARWHVPDIKRLTGNADTLAKDLERQNDMLREIMKEVRQFVCLLQYIFC